MKVCVICDKEIKDLYGHNAQPKAEGLCCSECNFRVVIPARLAKTYNYKPIKKKKDEET